MSTEIAIAGRRVGRRQPPLIVAELSGNHNGSLDRALALIDAAKEAGADAVKMQTYTADTITIDHPGAEFRIAGGPWDGRTLHDLYEEAHTPWEWHAAMFARARGHGMLAFSAPFDDSAVDFLETLDCPAYKIASFELVDLPLIRRAASTGKPLIMSTGMANLDEIGEAVAAARDAGCREFVVLHCVSSYPAPDEDTNLLTLPHLAETFSVPTGLSDHTLGTAVAVAAIGLGAVLIEKHLTLARTDGGPDSGFSLEPSEFAALARDCRAAYAALGRVHYDLKGSEAGNIQFRRSLYFVADLAAGEAIGPEHVRSIRPGYGLAPKFLDTVLGKRAARPVTRGTPVTWDAIE
ncbi:MAG TPA: pseudaminic acid synthase [Stellaceae bacterium]|jgi:N-acetylneuraminate synthase